VAVPPAAWANARLLTLAAKTASAERRVKCVVIEVLP
jgi:hypothetical protein